MVPFPRFPRRWQLHYGAAGNPYPNWPADLQAHMLNTTGKTILAKPVSHGPLLPVSHKTSIWIWLDLKHKLGCIGITVNVHWWTTHHGYYCISNKKSTAMSFCAVDRLVSLFTVRQYNYSTGYGGDYVLLAIPTFDSYYPAAVCSHRYHPD